MPVGQFVGPKKKVQYESDSGDVYILLRDETLAGVAGVGLVDSDPATDPDSSPAPRGFKPRGVYWQSNDDQTPPGARKFLICGTPLAALYATSAGAAVTVDGVAGRTTGRRGETLSF